MMVNYVLSNLRLSRMVVPEMREWRGGSIICITSVATVRATTTLGGYRATKAADRARCGNLGVSSGADNVAVEGIASSFVKIEFPRLLNDDPRRSDAGEPATLLSRVDEPEDIAGLALLVASPAGTDRSGRMINVNGGAAIAP